MVDLRKVLSAVFLFDNVPDEVFKEELGEVVSFDKGDVIYEPLNFSNSLGIFLKGKANAYKNDNVVLNTFSEGDTFGAAAVFGRDKPYVSTIIALKPCDILFISENTLRNLFFRYPQISINYIGFLSSKVRYLNDKIDLFTTEGAKKRLYLYLSSGPENERCTEKKVNMSNLSKTLNIGRTSLYRALEELQRDRLISLKDGRIKIL